MNCTVFQQIEDMRETNLAEKLSLESHKPWYVFDREDRSAVVLSDENLFCFLDMGYEARLCCVPRTYKGKEIDRIAADISLYTGRRPWYVYTSKYGHSLLLPYFCEAIFHKPEYRIERCVIGGVGYRKIIWESYRYIYNPLQDGAA